MKLRVVAHQSESTQCGLVPVVHFRKESYATDCAGKNAECVAACVCVREHFRSEVQPRRPTSCTESAHGSRLIGFRCDQDCSHLTCNQTVQETLQSESFTCSHCRCLGSYNRNYFDGALFDSKGVIAECAGGRPEYGSAGRVCEKTCSFWGKAKTPNMLYGVHPRSQSSPCCRWP